MNSPCAWRRLATALDRIATAVTAQDTLLNYLMAIDDTLQCNWKSLSKMVREDVDVLNSARSEVSAVAVGRAPGAYVTFLQDAWRCGARGARRITRAVGGTLRSRALPHRDRGESDFHAGNDSDRPRCLGPPRLTTNCHPARPALCRTTTPTGLDDAYAI